MRRTLTAFLLASAISIIITTPAASAGEWEVNGTKLLVTAALSSTALVLTYGKFEILGGLNISINCTSETIQINQGQLTAPDSLLVNGITLTECRAPSLEEASCAITSKTVSILPLKGLVSLDGSLGAFVELLPQTHTEFGVIPLEGPKCTLAGPWALAGGVDFLLHDGRDARTSHLALVFALPGQLRVGPDEVLLVGLGIDVRLANGQTWNFL